MNLIFFLDDERVLTFEKNLERVKNNRAKHSISKRTKFFKNDLIKYVDKILNPPLALPVDENEE